LMQFQSDILKVDVICPPYPESTALGAALLAGLAVDFYHQNDVRSILPGSKTFEPKMGDNQRDELYKGWLKAAGRTRNWVRE